MENEPRGRRLILTQRIEDIRSRIAIYDSLSPQIESDEPDENKQRLRELLDELEQERLHKRIVLLGIEHGCQRNGNQANQELALRIISLTNELAATVLMEEWSHNAPPSFASTLGMLYKNISTGSEKRFETHWSDVRFPGYINGTLDASENHPSMAEYGPLKNQENREKQMVTNIREAMDSQEVGLVLIGLAHLHSMSQKLLSAGFNVSAFTWLSGRTS